MVRDFPPHLLLLLALMDLTVLRHLHHRQIRRPTLLKDEAVVLRIVLAILAPLLRVPLRLLVVLRVPRHQPHLSRPEMPTNRRMKDLSPMRLVIRKKTMTIKGNLPSNVLHRNGTSSWIAFPKLIPV
jgi:hypothetical protein